MPKRTIRLLAAMCVLAAVLMGITSVRAAPGQQFLFYSGLFTVGPDEIAYCYLAIDDPGGPSAQVVLQFLDENGVVLAHRDARVLSGHSAAVRTPGPDLMRCRIQLTETATFPLSPTRARLPSAEVKNTITNGVRPIPMHDSQQVPSRP